MRKETYPDVLVVLGTTATGKTAVSVQLAKMINGEIISCDSMQIYKGMDIGTAKPTRIEREEVPFHLVDIVYPNEYYSASSYQADALIAINEILSRGRVPIISGGTGFWLRSLVEGYTIPPIAEDRELKLRLKEEVLEHGSTALHERLSKVDPITAERINPQDAFRIVRALEVFYASGKTISSQQKQNPIEFNIRKYGLSIPTPQLWDRIEQRVEEMITAGWVEEVEALLKAGFGQELPAMKGLGYKRLVELIIDKKVNFEETVNLIKIDTRQFAKRQRTWFRKEQGVVWFDAQEGIKRTASQILDAL